MNKKKLQYRGIERQMSCHDISCDIVNYARQSKCSNIKKNIDKVFIYYKCKNVDGAPLICLKT